MGWTLDIYRRLISILIRSQLQYRLAFLMETTSTMLMLFLYFVSIALVMQRFGSIGGWTVGEIAFLIGMVEIAFGSMDLIFSGFDPQRFGQSVRVGTFDQILLRPVNVTIQVLGSEFQVRRIGRIIQGMAVLGIAIWLTGIDWTVGKIIYLPLVIASLVCFFGGLFVIGATISFWTIDSVEAMNILTYGGNEMASYPAHIYPNWLRRFFTYVVPAAFLNYYPALYFLDKADPLGLPYFARFMAPVAGVGVLAIALLFWRFGQKHYQSTGS